MKSGGIQFKRAIRNEYVGLRVFPYRYNLSGGYPISRQTQFFKTANGGIRISCGGPILYTQGGKVNQLTVPVLELWSNAPHLDVQCRNGIGFAARSRRATETGSSQA